MRAKQTVREMAREFSALVTRAHEQGKARWAKQRSDFPTRAEAEESMDRLRRELGMGAALPSGEDDAPRSRHPAVVSSPRPAVPVYEGPARPFTVRVTTAAGEEWVHRSMAPHWVRAMGLALVEAWKRGIRDTPQGVAVTEGE